MVTSLVNIETVKRRSKTHMLTNCFNCFLRSHGMLPSSVSSIVHIFAVIPKILSTLMNIRTVNRRSKFTGSRNFSIVTCIYTEWCYPACVASSIHSRPSRKWLNHTNVHERDKLLLCILVSTFMRFCSRFAQSEAEFNVFFSSVLHINFDKKKTVWF